MKDRQKSEFGLQDYPMETVTQIQKMETTSNQNFNMRNTSKN